MKFIDLIRLKQLWLQILPLIINKEVFICLLEIGLGACRFTWKDMASLTKGITKFVVVLCEQCIFRYIV